MSRVDPYQLIMTAGAVAHHYADTEGPYAALMPDPGKVAQTAEAHVTQTSAGRSRQIARIRNPGPDENNSLSISYHCTQA